MQRVYKIGVLDSTFEKIGMYVLWPRFSYIFDMHISNIRRCDPKNFKVNNQVGVHGATTLRCLQLLIGLYKLQEEMQINDQTTALKLELEATTDPVKI